MEEIDDDQSVCRGATKGRERDRQTNLELGLRDADLLAEADRVLGTAEELRGEEDKSEIVSLRVTGTGEDWGETHRGAVRVERLVARLGARHGDAVDRLDALGVLAARLVPCADTGADTEL